MQKTNNNYLTKIRKQDISELAEEVAKMYCPRGVIEPEIIAEDNDIKYSYGKYNDDFDGLIEHQSSNFHIFINTDRLINPYSERARFTFAHELGHYFIDEHRNSLELGFPPHGSFTGFVSEIYTEREADYFAACLLLPESRVKNDCFKRKFSFSIINELAKKYQASKTATALRFADIGNHPILVLCANKNKVKWKWSSKDFPYFYLKHRKLKIPEDTIMGEYLYEGKSCKGTQEVWAMDWFEGVRDRDIDRKFYEHCYAYSGNAVSVIWED